MGESFVQGSYEAADLRLLRIVCAEACEKRPGEGVVQKVGVRAVPVLDFGRTEVRLRVRNLRHVQCPARSAAASMILTFGPSASRKASSSSSSMMASPKPAAISIAVERIRKN